MVFSIAFMTNFTICWTFALNKFKTTVLTVPLFTFPFSFFCRTFCREFTFEVELSLIFGRYCSVLSLLQHTDTALSRFGDVTRTCLFFVPSTMRSFIELSLRVPNSQVSLKPLSLFTYSSIVS